MNNSSKTQKITISYDYLIEFSQDKYNYCLDSLHIPENPLNKLDLIPRYGMSDKFDLKYINY